MSRLALALLLMSGCGTEAGSDAGSGTDAGTDAASDAGSDAGTDAGSPLPICPVLAAFELSALMAPGRDSDAYVAPSSDTTASLSNSIRELIAGDEVSALTSATSAGYVLCRGEGGEGDLHLWAPVVADEGGARVALRLDGEELVFEAPHPLFDSTTVAEALTLFTDLRGRALIASGAHRCASSSESACDGTTSVCGTTAPFRISDAAHDVSGTFQSAHGAISEAFATDLVISVHGMGGAGISISNGTSAPTLSTSPVARLALALSSRFADVTSCNTGAGVPRTVRLCGTTNVQGRHVNASPDACTASASSASERFVHLEQSRSVRDSVPMVVAAFAEALAP